MDGVPGAKQDGLDLSWSRTGLIFISFHPSFINSFYLSLYLHIYSSCLSDNTMAGGGGNLPLAPLPPVNNVCSSPISSMETIDLFEFYSRNFFKFQIFLFFNRKEYMLEYFSR